jgi:hypothetical protein
MTHEAKKGAELSDQLPEEVDVEALSYEEFLAKFPEDRPEDEELVNRAVTMNNRAREVERGQG